MTRTKIVCTIGPASESPDTIRALIQNGMSVAMLHFSQGKRREYHKRIWIIRLSPKRWASCGRCGKHQHASGEEAVKTSS